MFLHINVCVSHSKLYTVPVYLDVIISFILIYIYFPLQTHPVLALFIFREKSILQSFSS
nr:MAG TPA: hypothetical protein [Caudoviricetes sp.]